MLLVAGIRAARCRGSSSWRRRTHRRTASRSRAATARRSISLVASSAAGAAGGGGAGGGGGALVVGLVLSGLLVPAPPVGEPTGDHHRPAAGPATHHAHGCVLSVGDLPSGDLHLTTYGRGAMAAIRIRQSRIATTSSPRCAESGQRSPDRCRTIGTSLNDRKRDACSPVRHLRRGRRAGSRRLSATAWPPSDPSTFSSSASTRRACWPRRSSDS